MALYGKSQPTIQQSMFTPQGNPQHLPPFPTQPAFISPFVNRPSLPAQAITFPSDNAIFPSTHHVANPFYCMGGQAPSTSNSTQAKGQQIQFATPVSNQNVSSLLSLPYNKKRIVQLSSKNQTRPLRKPLNQLKRRFKLMYQK
ncbi:uncharacterized protein LOC113468365 [Diaphorina citri]|uniref:Uncharacterized protein LOC113468365 n=1 Tax=Diaphorina citri TaxID=121845 RepID=A0A3Q0IXQ4_DIACI|nr:uncharacterized protein LOC113468365 [Diaphorina citri]